MIVGHEKPPLDEALLRHYGVKGMHWGIRKKYEPVGDSPAAAKAPSKVRTSKREYQAVKIKRSPPKEAAKNIRKTEELSLEKANVSDAGTKTKKGLSDGQKKALFIGAGALAAAAIVGGAAYAHHKGYIGNSAANKAAEALRSQYLKDVDLAKTNAWNNFDSYIQPSSFERKAFTLPPGHTFHRVSRGAEKTFARNGVTYTSHALEDFHRYAGNHYTSWEFDKLGRGTYNHITFTAKSEIKVPDLTTALDTLKDVMKTSGEHGAEVSREDVMKAYTGMSGGSWEGDLARNFIKELRSKGYGAIVDEMDAGVVSESPLVVFAHDLMSEKKSAPITLDDVKNARRNTRPLKNAKLIIKEAIG